MAGAESVCLHGLQKRKRLLSIKMGTKDDEYDYLFKGTYSEEFNNFGLLIVNSSYENLSLCHFKLNKFHFLFHILSYKKKIGPCLLTYWVGPDLLS